MTAKRTGRSRPESWAGFLTPGKFMEVTDLDGDANPDLLEAGLLDVGIVVWGSDTGAMTQHIDLCITTASVADPHGIGAGDFDGDGRQDIVVANNREDGLSFLGGTSSRTFRSPRL